MKKPNTRISAEDGCLTRKDIPGQGGLGRRRTRRGGGEEGNDPGG